MADKLVKNAASKLPVFVSRSELWLAHSSFRSTYKFPEYFSTNQFIKWYPGHMEKGLRVMQSRVVKCDCVVEIHDARIPFSGRNPKFSGHVSGRPHVLVLNKVDLAEPTLTKHVLKRFESQGVRTVFTNCKPGEHDKSVKKIVPAIMDAIKDAEYEGTYICKDPERLQLVVCGLPNTGKSSFINNLRRYYLKKGPGTPVGKLPGMTKSVMEKIKIKDEPAMYIYDTPGVMAPYITSAEVGIKLALIGCMKDHEVGEDIIADYLLYIMNKTRKFKYAQIFGLSFPSDDINFVTRQVARTLKLKRDQTPNYLQASNVFISKFRNGEFGKFTLDDV